MRVWAAAHEVDLHGSRIQNVMAALAIRQPQVQSDIVYMSALQLAEMTGQDERTIRRAVADLTELGGEAPVVVTRPNPCEGERCGYRLRACPGFHGGKTLDEDGRAVGAANGFSMNPAWIQRVRALRMVPSRALGQPTRATRERERQAALQALERRQAAAQPAPATQGRPEPAAGPLAGALGDVVGRIPERGRGP